MLKIRLESGETLEQEFNIVNKLQDVFIYVNKKSKIEKEFKLYAGFPPKQLEHMDKTLDELNLIDTIIYQKIS